ncbi:hypothetical protein B0H11DRAFT_2215231 [Mycena galericulata]|nr:hypothetical protein B0H11DRAFT_2215231 [Mycena galericulata]
MSAAATFSDVAVSTAFNSAAATSCISLAWILNAGLQTHNSRASGLVKLPCKDGIISMTMDIPVAASLTHDLVLGMDWFHFVRAAAPQLIVHLSSGSLDAPHLVCMRRHRHLAHRPVREVSMHLPPSRPLVREGSQHLIREMSYPIRGAFQT